MLDERRSRSVDARAASALDRVLSTRFDATGMVSYRSHMHKSLKRNFQLMPGAQWLDQSLAHKVSRHSYLMKWRLRRSIVR